MSDPKIEDCIVGPYATLNGGFYSIIVGKKFREDNIPADPQTAEDWAATLGVGGPFQKLVAWGEVPWGDANMKPRTAILVALDEVSDSALKWIPPSAMRCKGITRSYRLFLENAERDWAFNVRRNRTICDLMLAGF